VIQGLPVGTYTFKEKAAPAGYVLNPEAFTFIITASGSILGSTTIADTRMSVRLGDIVWDDVDKDGIQDMGEAGIPDVVLTISGPNGSSVKNISDVDVGPATTDSSGMYIFSGLPILAADQSYTVSIEGQSDLLTLSAGSNMTHLDAGVFYGSINGTIVLDADKSGNISAGDTPLALYTVTLRNTSTGDVWTTMTDVLGVYRFIGLPLGTGTRYVLSVTTPDGTVIQFAPTVGQSLTRTSPELMTQNFGYVPVAAPTAVPTSPSDVLGTNRTPTAAPTSTPKPTSGVLGTAKTGETANMGAFSSVLILLSAAALLVLFEKRRRYDKNEKGEEK